MDQETIFSSKAYLDMELFRFTTAGSVDDGKSTLIGRLLYDSKSIFQDQMEAVERASMKKGEEHVNLALLTDGLRAEREQGITIDVAYRYFATPKRKFIIADTPGHIQYTRNMVTGASTANAAIILIDARNGVIEQTYRHTFIAKLLQIPHIVVAVNKMDLVAWSEDRYNEIVADYKKFAAKFDIIDMHFVPLSALLGDNVVDASKNMDWYKGNTLLKHLETIPIQQDRNYIDGRFPVQYVIRPQSTEFHDFRGYAGRVAGGIFKKGDKVKVLPNGLETTISAIWEYENEMTEVYPPQSAILTLSEEIDISRGDMIVQSGNEPQISSEFEVMMCWMHERPMQTGKKYVLRHTTAELKCMPKEVVYKLDVNTQEEIDGNGEMKLNEIGRVKLKTTKPLFFDSYNKNRSTGSLILIDEVTNETVGVGMII
jgi:sulfate adenylyltransferase subunit 1